MARKDTLLITGGAGYIGAHAVLAFRKAGHRVVVLDNLSTGRRATVADDIPLIEADAGDRGAVKRAISDFGITAVVHFAASVDVGESVAKPLVYYRNNSGTSANLIRTCIEAGVTRFVYSSTAAVYGIPDELPVSENAGTAPINPYGASKLVVEWMLRDAMAAHGLRCVVLRYFNVAGADPDGRAGQSSPSAGHLITVACRAAVGPRNIVTLFGADYDTPDGTCLRDYIHVSDLAEAHVAALNHLASGGSGVFNCGYGRGSSVREVIEAVQRQAGKRIEVRTGPRRPGDPPALVADPSRLQQVLRWSPRYADLDFIVRTALSWERKLTASAEPPPQ